MTLNALISYDGTATDRDALALGGLFAAAGARLSLAYVRHATEQDPARELAAEQAAHDLLQRGADELGIPAAPRHIVLHGSTGAGLRQLAEREEADVVIFGSDYRTPAGSVAPGGSARRLLDGGPVAVAIAPAHLAEGTSGAFARIGVLADGPDLAAPETARSIAHETGAEIVDPKAGDLDLLVVGSRPEAELARVTLSALAEYAVELSRCPVLAVPRGTALRFEPSLITV
jgi:nucleotide-binding universal stress UspA family protein